MEKEIVAKRLTWNQKMLEMVNQRKQYLLEELRRAEGQIEAIKEDNQELIKEINERERTDPRI